MIIKLQIGMQRRLLALTALLLLALLDAAILFRATFEVEDAHDGPALPEFLVEAPSTLAEACAAYVASHGVPATAADCVGALQGRFDMVVSASVPPPDDAARLRLFPDLRGAAVNRHRNRSRDDVGRWWWSGAELRSCQDRTAVVALAAMRSSTTS